jgi:hypothetical protein
MLPSARVADGMGVIVAASRGCAQQALGSACAFLPVWDSATGIASTWDTWTRSRVARSAAEQAVHRAASGSMAVPAATRARRGALVASGVPAYYAAQAADAFGTPDWQGP